MEVKKHNLALAFFTALFSGLISVCVCRNGGYDYDFLWHIKLGELFVEKKAVVSTDLFSWVTSEGFSLVETAHSWLSEVLMYGLFCLTEDVWTFALVFVFLFSFFLTLVISLLFYKEHSAYTIIFSIFIGLMCCNPRPQLISNILFVSSVYILTEYFKNRQSNAVWLLPLFSLLWANLHGGTVPILFAFEGLFVVLCTLDNLSIGRLKLETGEYKRSENSFETSPKHLEFQFNIKSGLKMSAILILSMISGLLNPYGLKLYGYFFITNNEATKRFVSEWTPGSILNPYTLVILLLLFIPLVFYKTNIPLEKWILPAICLVLGGIHQRILLYGILSALPLFEDICDNFSPKKKGNPYSKKELLALMLILLLFSFCFCEKSETNIRFPENLVSFLKEKNYDRLYNAYDEGAKLIYEDIECFVDSRADLYPEDILIPSTLFTTMSFDTVGDADKFLSKNDFDAILLRKDYVPALEFMNLKEEWSLVFDQDGYYVYEKVEN